MSPLCLHPWVSLDISPQFEYKPCCKLTCSLGNTLEEYQNSPKLKEIKQTLASGNFPAECSRCHNDENAKLLSKRLVDQDQLDALPIDKIGFLSFTFGNSCNLSCTTCSSSSSSKWNTIAQQLDKKFSIPVQPITNLKKHKATLPSFLPIIKDVKNITLVGGEPLLYQIEIIRLLSQITKQNDCSVSITTNATILPSSELLDVLSKFKNTHFQLSIDGTHDTFESLRFPAKWQQVYENIKAFQSLPNITLSIGHTVSTLNVDKVNDFIIWCKKEKLPLPYLGMVSKPISLSITSLPKERKASLKNNVPATVFSYMNTRDTSTQYQLGLEYVKQVDFIRRQL